jgi:hypothetical protein
VSATICFISWSFRGEGARALPVAAVAPDLLEVDERDPAHLVEQLVELVDLQAERVGDLVLAGGAAETLLDLAVGPLEAPALLAHAARDPVQRAQLVEDGTLDAELRVGLELAVLLGVVLLDRIHQADDARVVQIVEVDVRGQTHRDAVDDVANEGCVLENDLFLQTVRHFRALLLRVAKHRLHSFLPDRSSQGALAVACLPVAGAVPAEAQGMPRTGTSGWRVRGGAAPA